MASSKWLYSPSDPIGRVLLVLSHQFVVGAIRQTLPEGRETVAVEESYDFDVARSACFTVCVLLVSCPFNLAVYLIGDTVKVDTVPMQYRPGAHLQ